MKASTFLFTFFLALSGAFAQTSTVPRLMSYQGRVTDAAGTPIGNVTPVNRTVTFRFYSASTGGTAVYAETQTVTISGGEFSVLIGNGTGVSGSPGPSAPATSPYKTLTDVINSATGANLYLGITVDDGNSSTADAEIVPRQQLVSGAYAMRASVAEAVASGAVTTAMLGDSSVATNSLQAKAVTSAKIADNGVITTNIANAAVTASKLDTSTIGLWTPSGSNIYRNSNVGIGQSNPGVPLSFADVLGEKIALHSSNNSTKYGFGVQNNLLQVYTGGNGADIAFGYGSSASMTETMRVKGNGNVGIGTTAPSAKLHVNAGNVLVQNSANPSARLTAGGSEYSELALATAAGSYSGSALTNDTVLRASNKLHLQSGNGNSGLTLDQSNRAGFGTSTPYSTIEAVGAIQARDSGVGPNNTYPATIRSTRAANTGQHINLVRDGNWSWSLGFYPNTNTFGIGGSTNTDSAFNPAFTINNSGRVGVGTTNYGEGTVNISGAFTSVGSRNGAAGYARMYYDNAGIMVFEGYNTPLNNGQWRGFSMDGNNDLDWRSDARLKKDIEDAEPMLDRLMQVQFRRYHWIDSSETQKEFGVIAQELAPLFPELVGKRGDGMLTVGYTSFATIACKAIQELKSAHEEKISKLEDEISGRDARISELEARLDALEKRITGAGR